MISGSAKRFFTKIKTIPKPLKYTIGFGFLSVGCVYAAKYNMSDEKKALLKFSRHALSPDIFYWNCETNLGEKTKTYLQTLRYYYDNQNKGVLPKFLERDLNGLNVQKILTEMVDHYVSVGDLINLKLVFEYFDDLPWNEMDLNTGYMSAHGNADTIEFLIKKKPELAKKFNRFTGKPSVFELFHKNGWITEDNLNGETFKVALEKYGHMCHQEDRFKILLDVYEKIPQQKKNEILRDVYGYSWCSKLINKIEATYLLEELISKGGSIQSIDHSIFVKYNGEQHMLLKFLVDNEFNFHKKDVNGESVMFFLEKFYYVTRSSDCYFGMTYSSELIKLIKELKKDPDMDEHFDDNHNNLSPYHDAQRILSNKTELEKYTKMIDATQTYCK